MNEDVINGLAKGFHKPRKDIEIGPGVYTTSRLRTTDRTIKPCGYGEYDNLSGYVTDTYTSHWQDKDGTRWRTTVTVVNLGRPDRGTPADGEMIERPEAWSEREYVEPSVAQAAHHELARLRHEQGRARIIAHLEASGLQTVTQVAKALGMEREWLRLHLCDGEGMFYQRIRTNHGDRWGITGMIYAETDALPDYAKRVRAALLEHGPLTVVEFCKLAGVSKGSATGRMAKMTDVFHAVGCKYVPRPDGSLYPVTMWGVVGVHDGEAA